MGAPTLTGTVNIELGTTTVTMNVQRNLFRKKIPFTSTAQALVDSLTGALRVITVKGIYTGNSTALDTWESNTDFNWASVGTPEVKTFTAQSGETMSVLPDDLRYDRYFNRIEYTLILIETIKTAAS